MKTKTTTEYILTEEEVKVILVSLDYVYHRFKDHNCKLSTNRAIFDRLRKELRYKYV